MKQASGRSPPQFSAAGSFSEGLAAVKRDGKSGFINQTGKLVI
ncbi:WG repeat-containing protein [Microcoleus vaginatus]